jgi:RND superfamily putative drug exporter
MSANRPAEAQSFTARLALWSARHRRRVVIAWVLTVVIAMAACSTITADNEVEDPKTGETGKVLDLLDDRFGAGQEAGGFQEIVVFEHPSLTVDHPEYQDTVEALLADLRNLRTKTSETMGGTTVVSSARAVSGTTSHYDIGAPREGSPFVAMRENAGDVTFALVDLEGDEDEVLDNIDPLLEAVEVFKTNEAPDFEILMGGDRSQFKQLEDVISEDFGRALFLNLPITFIILILAFGAAVAALVPLALALAAIIAAMAILAIVTQVMPLEPAYGEVVLLLGLATGIDYSLFIVTRYRSERRAGRSQEEALVAASGTSGKAVVFAGATVVLALTGMFFTGFTVFTGLGIAAITVVSLAIVVSVTLLPALLFLLGDNVNRLRVPFLGRSSAGGGVWGAIADRVLARPAVFATVVTVGLLALAFPLLTINLGDNGARGLDDAVKAKAALLKLEDNFTLGLTSPALVVVDAGKNRNVFAESVQSPVNQFIRDVQAETVSAEKPDALFGAPIQTDINSAGDTQLIQIPINGDLWDDNSVDGMNRLRDDLIPASFEDSAAEAVASGATGFIMDFRDQLNSRTPIVLAWVMGLVFVLLLVVFRSIVIPIKAILLNSLSVAAAYGFLVLVFQEGWLLEGILDFEHTGVVTLWVPLFLFSIIFGLSQDYHIFVLSRIKESYEGGKSNEESVSEGIKATAPTITSAAVIIVAVASIFAFTRVMALKQFGVGLAVAVLIDATLIRSVLLPASMKLLGDWNWYLPSWLQWIPKIKMAE